MISLRSIIGLGLGLVLLTGCGRRRTGAITPLKKQLFGKTADGQEIDLYTLANKNGVEIGIMNYGGTSRLDPGPGSERETRRRSARLRFPRRVP